MFRGFGGFRVCLGGVKGFTGFRGFRGCRGFRVRSLCLGLGFWGLTLNPEP